MTSTAVVPIRPKRNGHVSKNARTRADFAKLITEAWQSTLEGIYQTGNWLETAKAELPHGDWLLMIKNDLPFEASKAERLMRIAGDERLRDPAHGPNLPVSWRTQYELSKLDDDTFAAALADGRINPKMERKDALALRPNRPRKPRKPAKPKPQRAIGAIDRCAMAVRATVFNAAEELDPDQWDALVAELRGELADIEQVLKERGRGDREGAER